LTEGRSRDTIPIIPCTQSPNARQSHIVLAADNGLALPRPTAGSLGRPIARHEPHCYPPTTSSVPLAVYHHDLSECRLLFLAFLEAGPVQAFDLDPTSLLHRVGAPRPFLKAFWHETGNRIRQVHVACERPLRLDRVHCGSKVRVEPVDLKMAIRLNCEHLGEIVGKRTPFTTAIDILDMERSAVM
jgi:hypothetical protein